MSTPLTPPAFHLLRRLCYAGAGLIAFAVGASQLGDLASNGDPTASGMRRPSPQAPAVPSQPLRDADGRGGSFSLLTYRMGGVPNWLTGGMASARAERIGPQLNAYDLVLLQEDFSHHEALESAARHRHQSVPQARSRALVHDGLNRFSQFDFAPVTRQAWHRCHGWLGGGRDCLANKGFSVSETELGPGVHLHVYNLDTDQGQADADVAARRAQFSQLGRYIRRHSRGHSVLLAGDTHLLPGDPRDARTLARFLDSTGLQDACATLHCEASPSNRVLYRSGPSLQLEPSHWEAGWALVDGPTFTAQEPAVHVRLRWRSDQAPVNPERTSSASTFGSRPMKSL